MKWFHTENMSSIFAVLLLVLIIGTQDIKGEPVLTSIRTSDGRIVYTNYPEYYYPYTLYDQTPARRYSNVLYYSQPSRSYDNTVYITDKFGRTSVQPGYDYYKGMATRCGEGVCGQNTQCRVASGRAVCSCLPGHTGNPLTYCKKSECTEHGHCPGHMSCLNDKCVNPCIGTCGVGANCDVRNHVAVCSCPRGYVGNPFNSCTKDPASDCTPSPCGQNAECRVVSGTATCFCLPGYFGSPLAGCKRECEINEECPSHLSCIDYKCQNPCSSQCGEGAVCETVRNHRAVCKCPEGYLGSPYFSCKPECTSHAECPSSKPACYNFQCKNPCDGVCGVGANCEVQGIKAICSCPKELTGDPFVQCRPFTPSEICSPNICGVDALCEPGYHKNNNRDLVPVCFCRSGYTGDPLRRCYPMH